MKDKSATKGAPPEQDAFFIKWGKGSRAYQETSASDEQSGEDQKETCPNKSKKSRREDHSSCYREKSVEAPKSISRKNPEAASEKKPKAVLSGCNTGMDADKYGRAMAELSGLAKACGLRVVSTIVQNAPQVTHATYLGSGKVRELKNEVELLDADIVLFNEALTPMQTRNLEKELDTEVLDRTGLILQIFASRARTREAKLQVESAQLQYMLPRLVGMRASLSRQGGGSGRLSNKGAGEQKLELDRRRIEHRIAELSRDLEVVERERATQRGRRLRTGLARVALVGYTNAGKSTVMNALLEYCAAARSKKTADTAGQYTSSNGNVSACSGKAVHTAGQHALPEDTTSARKAKNSGARNPGFQLSGNTTAHTARNPGAAKPNAAQTPVQDTLPDGKKVFQADMLFATLDTAVRRIDAPGAMPFLLSDTVGFVGDLPHSLVKAFRSTLDEVRYADLLLEVVDFSDPDYQQQIDVTAKTLEEIGAGHIPVVFLYNKVDLVQDKKAGPAPVSIPYRRGDILYLAAGKRIGIPEILTLIDDALSEDRTTADLLIPYTKGGLLQQIRSCGVIFSEEYQADGIHVRFRCRKEDAARFR